MNLFGYLGSGSITIGEYVITLTPLTDGYELKVVHGADVQTGRLYGFNAEGYSAIREHVDKLIKDIADEFSDAKTYDVDDYCMYDGDFLRCTSPVVSPGPFNSYNWEKTNVADELAKGGKNIINDDETTTSNAWSASKIDGLFGEVADDQLATQNMLSDQYNPAYAYEVGDYVIKDNALYRCIGDTAGAWNPAKWENVNLCEELQNKKYMANEIEGLKESVDSIANALADILGFVVASGTVVWDPINKKYDYSGSITMKTI